MSPNRFELEALWSVFQEQSDEVNSWKWEAIDDACIGREWRESLEKLAKSRKLKWLLDDGVALQLVNLLPFFQNIVLKCGEQGNQVYSYSREHTS
jgi:pseudouridylate synthase / pseudouridine kinase